MNEKPKIPDTHEERTPGTRIAEGDLVWKCGVGPFEAVHYFSVGRPYIPKDGDGLGCYTVITPKRTAA